MNQNLLTLYTLYKLLYNKLMNELFVIDKTGQKLVLLMGTSFNLDPSLGHHIKVSNPTTGYVFRLTNELYVLKETKWHESMLLNIDKVKDVKIWQYCSGDNGLINSNYGWCVYHPDNGSDGICQFDHAYQALVDQKDSRRAMIIYTRPTMHHDFKEDGKNDFLCTTWNQFLIRDNKLYMFYVMRSNDSYFGTINNIPWAMYVYKAMFSSLKSVYPELLMGLIQWYVTSFHLYLKQFPKLVKLFNG